MTNKIISREEIVEIARGVFPGIRDDAAVVFLDPRYMGRGERSRLRHYQVIIGNLLYEFDASLITCFDNSQLLTIAKYKVNDREITHAIFVINMG